MVNFSEQYYGAIIEYDGTDFLGYQFQAEGRTVQGELEKAIEKITQMKGRVSAAGRTDGGVHATGQVIAFQVTWKHSLSQLHRALNAVLPPDIVISHLQPVDESFHPRFSALSRSYQYTILNQPWPSALEHRYSYHVQAKLDVEAMRQASRCLLGTHDFASFGKPTQGDSTIREVQEIKWFTKDSKVIFEITANAFLYRMVRKIVGTLIQIGLDQMAAVKMESILAGRNLTNSAPPAPAQGLCLVRVTYPEHLLTETSLSHEGVAEL